MILSVGDATYAVVSFGPAFAAAAVGFTIKTLPGLATAPAPAAVRSTTGVLNLGDGDYAIPLPAIATEGTWLLDVDTGGGSPKHLREQLTVVSLAAAGSDPGAIADAVLDELLTPHDDAGSLGAALLALLERITGGTVTTIGPVMDGGNLELVAGDDYTTAGGRAIDITLAGGPDLTTFPTLLFTIEGKLEVAATAVDADTFRVELTEAATLALGTGRDAWDLTGRDAGGRDRTLARGLVTVRADIGVPA